MVGRTPGSEMHSKVLERFMVPRIEVAKCIDPARGLSGSVKVGLTPPPRTEQSLLLCGWRLGVFANLWCTSKVAKDNHVEWEFLDV